MKAYSEQLEPEYQHKRAQQHRWQDGIFELLLGAGLVLYALFLTIRIEPPVDETVQMITQVALAAVLLFAGVVVFRLLGERMKANIAYPRTGFVSPRVERKKPSGRTIILAVVAIPVSAVVGLVFGGGLLYVFALAHINISLLLLSAMFAFPMVLVARRTGLARLYGLAGGIVLLGLLLTLIHATGMAAIVLLYGFSGVLVMLSGGFAMLHYLRQHPLNRNGNAANGSL